jgi:hypothetical protein
MAVKTRVALEVGGYNKPFHYAVIGTPSEYYIWYKAPNMKGQNSEWFKGTQAFKHFNKMREILDVNKNKDAFVSYLVSLYYTSNPMPNDISQ